MRPLLRGLTALLAVLTLYAGVTLFIHHHTDKPRSSNCLSNMKMIALASLQYTEDHDGLLPPSACGWRPLLPYARHEWLFLCPDDAGKALPFFALHPLRAGSRRERWQPAGATILHYEAVGLTPAYRHDDGSNLSVLLWRHHTALSVSYCDGHARWRTKWALPPQAIMQGTDRHYLK